ncbi:hypothetical protein HA402_003944 [Bradysia odoriphaga]|nr:hypothetical protein HA402_003944 [Bradysia odoriphaga]
MCVRNDFMDLLIQLKNSGYIDGDKVGQVTLQEITAQAFVFFLAGFETSSTTMAYCLYELSLSQDIQSRARKEIHDVLTKYNGEFTCDAVKEMHYINQIINESLRKYPPGAGIIRAVTKDYAVPGTNHLLQKGTLVWIPVYAIHHDPDIYPDPDVFDPDRFHPEEVQRRHPQSFLAWAGTSELWTPLWNVTNTHRFSIFNSKF